MSRILIAGARAPVALDLARSLQVAGHEVHLADVFAPRILRGFSRHTYAAPVDTPDAFSADVTRLNAGLAPDLIIPLCEEVFHLARVARDRPLPLYAPAFEMLMRLHSKLAFNAWARGLGLDAPLTERASLPVDPAVVEASVFKAEYSRFGVQCHIRKIPQEYKKKRKNVSISWLRQDYISGDDLCFYALAQRGRLTAFAAYRSDWRTKGGASYHFQPLDPALSARLRDIAARLIEAGDLTGQIACDLRLDTEGRLWLIECNPRATSGLHLLTHDPEALGRAFLTPDAPCLEAGPEPACVGLAMVMYGGPEAVRTGRIKPWRRDSTARDVLHGARLGALADTLAHAAGAASRGQGLARFLTRDIECNGWSD